MRRAIPVLGSVVLGTLLVFAYSAPAAATVFYVNGASNAKNPTGLTWKSAFKTVQSGINAALAGDQVWVAKRVYPEKITLKEGVAVYGGFGGKETALNQRNWTLNVTVLDGGGTGSVVTAGSMITAAARIDGFTVRNGNSIYAPRGYTSGGGIYCYLGSPTIANNTITGNSAQWGAGIYCDQSTPLITHNTISGNSGMSGAGIFCVSSSPNVSDNKITGNTATVHGGGMHLYYYSRPAVSNNLISANTAAYNGGGIYLYNQANAPISNNTISDNMAAFGGGIYSLACSAQILNNHIDGNTATSEGGGIGLVNDTESFVANNLISTNTATTGGGIRIASTYGMNNPPKIVNNTLDRNSVSGLGGGIHCSSSSPSIANNIVTTNTDGIYVAADAFPVLNHNDVYGNLNGDYSGIDPAGSGDISADPLFVDAASANYHLGPGSPCIDAGDDIPVFTATDIDGQSRINNLVDIGADEYF